MGMNPAEAGLPRTTLQHLSDAVVAQRSTVLAAEPQLGTLRLRVAGPDAEVAVEGLGCLRREGHSPRPPALAEDRHQVVTQIGVVEHETSKFGAANPGVKEHPDNRGVPPISEAL